MTKISDIHFKLKIDVKICIQYIVVIKVKLTIFVLLKPEKVFCQQKIIIDVLIKVEIKTK